jgi:hypothetical protein
VVEECLRMKSHAGDGVCFLRFVWAVTWSGVGLAEFQATLRRFSPDMLAVI